MPNRCRGDDAPRVAVVRSVRWLWGKERADAADANTEPRPVLSGAEVTLDIRASSRSSSPSPSAVDDTTLFSGETHVCPESAFHCFVPGVVLSVPYVYPDPAASCWDMQVSGSRASRDTVRNRVHEAVTSSAPHAAGNRHFPTCSPSSLKWGVSEQGDTTVLIDVSFSTAPASVLRRGPPSVTSTMLALLPSECGAFFEARGRAWDRSPRDIAPHVYTRALRPFLPPRPSGKTRAQLAQHMFDAYVRPAGQFVSPHHRLNQLPALFVASRRCSLAASTCPARATRDVLSAEDLMDLSKQRGSWAAKRALLAALVTDRVHCLLQVRDRDNSSVATTDASDASLSSIWDAATFVEDLLSFVDACAEEGLLDLWRAFSRFRNGPLWHHSAAGGKGTRFVDQSLEPCSLWLFLGFP